MLAQLAALAAAVWGALVARELLVKATLADLAQQVALMVVAVVAVLARLGLMARQLPAETAETA